MAIFVARILIHVLGLGLEWMLPALLLEVSIWVWCSIGYALAQVE